MNLHGHHVPELEKDLANRIRRIAHDLAPFGCYVEWAGQRKAKGAGNSEGLPDCFLYCGGHCIPIELKRFQDGRLSLAQTVAIERRAACGVETQVVRTEEEFIWLWNQARSGRLKG